VSRSINKKQPVDTVSAGGQQGHGRWTRGSRSTAATPRPQTGNTSTPGQFTSSPHLPISLM